MIFVSFDEISARRDRSTVKRAGQSGGRTSDLVDLVCGERQLRALACVRAQHSQVVDDDYLSMWCSDPDLAHDLSESGGHSVEPLKRGHVVDRAT